MFVFFKILNYETTRRDSRGSGAADYFFDFSGKIDDNFGEIKTGLYDK